MDTVIREYEATAANAATLVASLADDGYDIKHVVSPVKAGFYCLWSDKTVTRGDTALDMDECKAANFQSTAFVVAAGQH